MEKVKSIVMLSDLFSEYEYLLNELTGIDTFKFKNIISKMKFR